MSPRHDQENPADQAPAVKEFVAYTDESGNTGNNLFDPVQPWFWTGTLLANSDFEQVAKPYVDRWCQRLGVEELHGAEIGLYGLERIAHGIDVFVRAQDLHFIFAGVEKAHLAATKFTDTFLDDGNNKAVSPLHYRTRVFRVMFAAIADSFMTQQDREEFWLSYLQQDYEKFCNVASRFNTWVQADLGLDQRAKQILGDALEWAIKYPELVLPSKGNAADAPNAVALQVLISGLHQMFGNEGWRITRFIHDETNQFAKVFKTQYQLLKVTGHPSLLPQAQIGEYTETQTFDCPIEIESSQNFAGLQMVDLMLWLVKKAREGALSGMPDCRRLFGTINGRSAVGLFSTAGMRETANAMCAESMLGDLEPEQQKRAEEILEQLEYRRLEGMNEAS